MNTKLLALFMSLLVGNIMIAVNAQELSATSTDPVDTTTSPFPPIIAPISWSFLQIHCVPEKSKWCHYLANTTLGVALGYYLELPLKFLHEDLKGLRAECTLTKSTHKCSLFYYFKEVDIKPLFLARCTNYLFEKPVIYCTQNPLVVDDEPVVLDDDATP